MRSLDVNPARMRYAVLLPGVGAGLGATARQAIENLFGKDKKAKQSMTPLLHPWLFSQSLELVDRCPRALLDAFHCAADDRTRCRKE